MRYLLMIFLLEGLLAGCAAMSGLGNATQEASPVENRDIVSSIQIPTLEANVNEATSVPQPMAITVGPPKTPIAPIQGAPGSSGPTTTPLAGWQTFTSPALGVSVDYPTNWSVIENGTSVKFTSPQGQLILLQVKQSSGSASTSGQDCTTLINSYGQAGDICLEATTSTYRAVFKKSTDGSAPKLTLSTISQDKPTVFLQMFNSFRFTE